MPCTLLQGISERELSVYLPGSYDPLADKQYPVLYLMHGGGESHTHWESKGHLLQVADSLADAGITDEMIIVCPEGNQNNMIYFNAPHWKYEDYFFEELIPYIEKNYRTRLDKGGRAIAGFSMGGGAAVVYGVHHPELFSAVYDISGYLRRQPLSFLEGDPSAEWRQQIVEDNNPIRSISNGTAQDFENWRTVRWTIDVGDQDFTLEANMDFVKMLREKHIPYNMHVGSGNHDWDWVRPALIRAIILADKQAKVVE